MPGIIYVELYFSQFWNYIYFIWLIANSKRHECRVHSPSEKEKDKSIKLPIKMFYDCIIKYWRNTYINNFNLTTLNPSLSAKHVLLLLANFIQASVE